MTGKYKAIKSFHAFLSGSSLNLDNKPVSQAENIIGNMPFFELTPSIHTVLIFINIISFPDEE